VLVEGTLSQAGCGPLPSLPKPQPISAYMTCGPHAAFAPHLPCSLRGCKVFGVLLRALLNAYVLPRAAIMKKPSLRVSKWMGDIPVEAECTACAGVRFNVRPISHRPNREEYQKSLQSAYDAHLKNAHPQEDAKERVPGIAKEATESA